MYPVADRVPSHLRPTLSDVLMVLVGIAVGLQYVAIDARGRDVRGVMHAVRGHAAHVATISGISGTVWGSLPGWSPWTSRR